jgi:hypothetical protein
MNFLAIIWAGLLTSCAIGPATPAADGAAAYRDEAAKAGGDADSQVRLALWCEAHDLPARRREHLERALEAAPSHALARALLGLVVHRDEWLRPEDLAARTLGDTALTRKLAAYNARREKAANTADDQWRLALWCEREGLRPEAEAHLAAVTRLDPSRSEAWVRLGYKRHGRRWMTEAQVAAERAEAAAQRAADRYWQPQLERWKKGLHGTAAQQEEAERGLAGVTDPRAVPWAWRIFAKGTPGQQAVAVRLLGQIDAPRSSLALATLAVFGKAPGVRDAAAKLLPRRDPRDFLDPLIGLLQAPSASRSGTSPRWGRRASCWWKGSGST